MDYHVHYHSDSQAEMLQLLRSSLRAGIDLTAGTEIPNPATYRVLINGRPTRQQLEASPLLDSLIIPYAGVPEETRALLIEYPGVKVYNLHHNAAPTAEMAIALLMASAKFLLPFDRTFRHHDWRPSYQPDPAVLMGGKTALILGFGQIGQRVGLVCQALGMEVIAMRRHPEAPQLAGLQAQVISPEELDRVLPRAQVLIVTLPGTERTEGMIGSRQLAQMPPGGILVNVGRGQIVEQGALYQALRNGTLAAAGLDVWYNYPQSPEERGDKPPADYPFHELANVILSPHRGGGSREIEVLRMQHLAELINALKTNSPTQNLVDLAAGY